MVSGMADIGMPRVEIYHNVFARTVLFRLRTSCELQEYCFTSDRDGGRMLSKVGQVLAFVLRVKLMISVVVGCPSMLL